MKTVAKKTGAKQSVGKTAAQKKVVGKPVAKAAGKTPQKSAAEKPAGGFPELYYRSHALLNTVRCIAQHEDRLCVLVHEMKRRKGVGAALTKELRTLLGQMPVEDYAAELRALEDELG